MNTAKQNVPLRPPLLTSATCTGVDGHPGKLGRRRRRASIPRQLRRDVTEFLRVMVRKHREAFDRDPELRVRVGRLVRALLPPRPRRRGRPGNELVTRALILHRQLQKKYPKNTPRAIWAQICPAIISGYADMNDVEQRTAREQLQQRVAWRRRRRKKRSALAAS